VPGLHCARGASRYLVTLLDIRHHPIPVRLQRFIERAMTINHVHAVGMRWHALARGAQRLLRTGARVLILDIAHATFGPTEAVKEPRGDEHEAVA